MATNSKIVRVIILVLALCGGVVGALAAIKVSHRLELNPTLHLVLVSLGAACGFGTVWLFYWIPQNLFIEVPDEKKS